VRINHGPAHHNALGIHRHVGAAPDMLQLKTWTAGALACARENVAQARGPQRAAFARWGGGSPACASTGRLNLIRQ
jgi:hypothetical protein